MWYSDETPLTKAISSGNLDIVRILIESGADVYRANCHTLESALGHAVRKNNMAMVVMLILEYGIDAFRQPHHWDKLPITEVLVSTPAEIAVHLNHTNMTKFFQKDMYGDAISGLRAECIDTVPLALLYLIAAFVAEKVK